MKKFFLKFYSAPVVVAAVLSFFYIVGFIFFKEDLSQLTKENGITDITTMVMYLPLFVSLALSYKYFESKKHWGLFLFFSVCALLRELGIQHWLASKDTTALKSRFFTNPNNPLSEKIIAGSLALIFVIAFIYAMIKWLVPAFKGLFKLYSGSWTIITLLSSGALCKIADRLHSNLAKHGIVWEHNSIQFGITEICEETLEMCLPIIACLALYQYCKDKKLYY